MGKYSAGKRGKRRSRLVPVMLGVALALAAVNGLLLAFIQGEKEEPAPATEPVLQIVTADTQPPETLPPETVPPTTTAPVETQPQVLPYFAEQAAQNPDMVGWVKIEGTKLDYPLMYTPQEPDKYLHLDFEGNFSVGGLPFLEDQCTLESDNLLIYGHNMANGTMFHCLMSYDQKNYWQEHPVIYVSTLYEERAYEVIAALYDRVYLKTDDCFKFYQFTDAENQEEFDQAVAYFKEHALYDTGVTARYGDQLVTLVTCAYHVDNGRFLVVARRAADPPEPDPTA